MATIQSHPRPDQHNEDSEYIIHMLSNILRMIQYTTHLNNDQIWLLYSSWKIDHSSNRLQDFIRDHPAHFQEMTPLEKEREQRIKEHRQMMEWIQFRMNEEDAILRRMCYPEFRQKRKELRSMILSSNDAIPDLSFLHPTSAGYEIRKAFRSHFTIQELLDMGVSPDQFYTDPWSRPFDYAHMILKEKAYLALHSIQ